MSETETTVAVASLEELEAGMWAGALEALHLSRRGPASARDYLCGQRDALVNVLSMIRGEREDDVYAELERRWEARLRA